MRVESETDTYSTTTSLLAERIVENIGKRKQESGCGKTCKNFFNFYCQTLQADCCMKDERVGY